MKAAIIGANGQLGAEVCAEFIRNGEAVCPLTHAEVEISEIDSVRKVFGAVRPQAIINTAAMHHVENCEAEPLRAYQVNALGPRNLALVAKELDAVLIQVSTDYVFDGRKRQPYVETDPPLPLNVYGNTKLAGEAYVQAIASRYFIIRTSALYGEYPCRAKGRNFVQLMLKLARERDQLAVVDDEIVSPTLTTDLARQIVSLSRCEDYGLYHGTAEGSCSWYEFAREIFRAAGIQVRLRPALPNEFASKVPRPKYSVLENHGLKAINLNAFRPWQEGLRSYLTQA